jgi:hypothetical protein
MYIIELLLPLNVLLNAIVSFTVNVLPEDETDTLAAGTVHWLLLGVPLPPGATGQVSAPVSDMI